MRRLLTLLTFAITLTLAACGGTSEVGTGSGDAEGEGTPTEEPAEPDVAESLPVEEPSDPAVPVGDETVITNDVIVDPQVTSATELLLNPDDDTELWVRFIGGDPNCTAASVTLLTETPDIVEVELLVGITEDALARSCMAGEFALRVDLQLNESATGKTLFAVPGADDQPVLLTPDLSVDDFVGLTEDEATSLANENGLDNRIVRVDDEFFAVTRDFRPSRLNFEIDDDTVTVVTLG